MDTNNQEFEGTFSLKSFLKQVRHNLGKIIAVIILAVVSAHLVTTVLVEPQYTSNSKILIEGTSSDVLINNYREIITSNKVLSEALNSAHISASEMTTSQLAKSVKVTAETDTNIFTISVTASSPNLAAELNNNISETFITTTKPLNFGTTKASLSIFDDASVPTSPENINSIKTDAIAGLSALLLCLVIVYLTSPVEETVEVTKKAESKKVAKKINKETPVIKEAPVEALITKETLAEAPVVEETPVEAPVAKEAPVQAPIEPIMITTPQMTEPVIVNSPFTSNTQDDVENELHIQDNSVKRGIIKAYKSAEKPTLIFRFA